MAIVGPPSFGEPMLLKTGRIHLMKSRKFLHHLYQDTACTLRLLEPYRSSQSLRQLRKKRLILRLKPMLSLTALRSKRSTHLWCSREQRKDKLTSRSAARTEHNHTFLFLNEEIMNKK